MFSNHGAKSITLFVFSILALLLLSFFEKALSGLSISAERAFSIVLLVLPGLSRPCPGVCCGREDVLAMPRRPPPQSVLP